MNKWTRPLLWCWAFVAIWAGHVVISLFLQRWDGMTISLFGLLGAVMVVAAIESRRRKGRYPQARHGEHTHHSGRGAHSRQLHG